MQLPRSPGEVCRTQRAPRHEHWPEVASRLFRLFRSRVLSTNDAEDAVQEVAERAVGKAVAFDHVDEMFRWAATVGCNVVIDNHRRAEVRAGAVPAKGPADEVETSCCTVALSQLSWSSCGS